MHTLNARDRAVFAWKLSHASGAADRSLSSAHAPDGGVRVTMKHSPTWIQ
eukprot:gene283-4542_t